ncbi:MAG: hypothetical protein IKY78_02010 [Clostridia bacterium]|nr:hypothetical protein [Clostridia bacterium]
MKKSLSILLTVLLLLSCMLMAVPTAQAEKATEKRAIAIVFDNSGSMYNGGDMAWCRATYAMEVFASMLNEGDILQIYPMYEIEVGNDTYSKENPLEITKAADASKIREIYTPAAQLTPIESVDSAIDGLKKVSIENKYLIILTDGSSFYENDLEAVGDATVELLNGRIEPLKADGITAMYLGIGKGAAMPTVDIKKEKASDSAMVLSTLTDMCNLIFGRDSLPEGHFISDKKINVDVSTKKLIVFVQGTNIDNLKVTGSGIGERVGDFQRTMYSTKGSNKGNTPDTDLQGMMVTYKDSKPGIFDIDCDGDVKSIEVYYEPDVEMVFKFTDAATRDQVDLNELYEGDYTLEYGMIDGKDREKYAAGEPVDYISSDLVGECTYRGSYTQGEKQENGKIVEKTETFGNVIETGERKGEKTISLKKGDTFEAELELEYLSGYTIKKNSEEFGWPDGGITVQTKEVKGYRLEITDGQSSYPLQQLEAGKPYKATVYYENEPLPPEAYAEGTSLRLEFDEESSNAKIQVTPNTKEGYYELKLLYKDPSAPQNTKCGECTVKITAYYTPPKSDEAKKSANLTYNIKDDSVDLGVKLDISDDYIVIKDMAEAQPIIVNFTLNGAPLSPEEFKVVEKSLSVDCGGINYELIPDETNSAVKIKLLKTDKLDEGNYLITVKAQYTDSIGRVAKCEPEPGLITLSTMPMWLKWLIVIIVLVVLFIIIWTILHIKVLPTKLHTTKKLCTMYFDNEDVTDTGASFLAEIKNKSLKVQGKYGGNVYSVAVDVVPGKDSYLYKGQKNRSAEAQVASIRKYGPGIVKEITIGSFKYEYDEEKNKLAPAVPKAKPFKITNGMTVRFSGTVKDAGIDKDFEVISKLKFNK